MLLKLFQQLVQYFLSVSLLESIVAIFGLFSALTGIIFYFVIPICFAVMYPKVQKDHAQPGSANLDPIVVGVYLYKRTFVKNFTFQ
ncbi:Amino_acid transporter family protein [Hexamita inflata]|uniref:Amino acid transporter family protein n=1 Tax=Hexamita inflata TaxID=28002 RepID=A0AA86R943_9EUKA|nr:Amino acid transporter family protein [Hexamita inflata]